jgi:cobyrinic acid a,c-diamide synthase
LTVASELPDAMARLDALADAMAATPLGQLDAAGWQRWAVPFEAQAERPVTPRLQGRTVAVARDAAFCFTYPANLDTLCALGAELVFFSPVADEQVPDCDAVWLPGGYPELHADALVNGSRCRATLVAHIAAGRPVWAECGGMMPLFDGLVLADGSRVPMWGLLPGEVAMQPRLAALGPQRWDTAQGELRGHTFHFSLTTSPLAPVAQTVPGSPFGRPEAVYGQGPVRASYFHAWFPSNPEAAAHLFLPEST